MSELHCKCLLMTKADIPAEMAKDFGLVDKVIDKRPEMPPLAVVS